MTDEELRTLRGKLEILRKGTEDFVCATKTADLIEALLDEIDRLKKEYYGWDSETKAAFWRQADSIRKYQQETDQLKAEIDRLKSLSHDPEEWPMASPEQEALAAEAADELRRQELELREQSLLKAMREEIEHLKDTVSGLRM